MLGVAYLLAVSCLYFALGQRYDAFLRHGDTVVGTVVGFRHAPSSESGPLHSSVPSSGSRIAVIKYTQDGVKHTVTSNPYSRSQTYALGQKVHLVIHQGHTGDPSDDVVAVKDHNQTGLKAMPYAFLAAAVALAWFLAVHLHPGVLKRRRIGTA